MDTAIVPFRRAIPTGYGRLGSSVRGGVVTRRAFRRRLAFAANVPIPAINLLKAGQCSTLHTTWLEMRVARSFGEPTGTARPRLIVHFDASRWDVRVRGAAYNDGAFMRRLRRELAAMGLDDDAIGPADGRSLMSCSSDQRLRAIVLFPFDRLTGAPVEADGRVSRGANERMLAGWRRAVAFARALRTVQAIKTANFGPDGLKRRAAVLKLVNRYEEAIKRRLYRPDGFLVQRQFADAVARGEIAGRVPKREREVTVT